MMLAPSTRRRDRTRCALSVFVVCCFLIVVMGIAESLIDGDAPWQFLTLGYLPHRLAARIIDVPKAICGLVAVVAWAVASWGWLTGQLGRKAR